MLPPNLAALRRQLEAISTARTGAQAALLEELDALDAKEPDPAPPSRSIGPGVYLGKKSSTTPTTAETPVADTGRSLGPGVYTKAQPACIACQRPLP